MSLGVTAIIDAVASHAASLGVFSDTVPYEPRSAPGAGLTFGVWLGPITPVRARSGLAATSARVELAARIYLPDATEPKDDIDPRIADAIDTLFTALGTDIDLGGDGELDLLGAYGTPLQTSPLGYMDIDGQLFRIAPLTIPVVVDNVWVQAR